MNNTLQRDKITAYNRNMMRKELKEQKEKAKQRFEEYVASYNMEDPKIFLKVEHTYYVADLCQQIGEKLGLKEEELFVAYLCGLLHDIGRFEQIRRYHTFSDALSVDHAKLSVAILFGATKEQGILREFYPNDAFDSILYQSIAQHSAYRLTEDLSEQEKLYCQILRDADKIDIFRVNAQIPLEDIYDVTTEELKQSPISDEVWECFLEEHAVLREKKKTPIDYLVGHICLYFELVYSHSKDIAKEQGFLKQLCSYESMHVETRDKFDKIKKRICG